KTFAGETHAPYKQDADTPAGTARNDSLVRRNACLHRLSSRPAILCAGRRRVRSGPAFRSRGDRSDPRRRQPPSRPFFALSSAVQGRRGASMEKEIIQPCVACPGRYYAIGSIGLVAGRTSTPRRDQRPDFILAERGDDLPRSEEHT